MLWELRGGLRLQRGERQAGRAWGAPRGRLGSQVTPRAHEAELGTTTRPGDAGTPPHPRPWKPAVQRLLLRVFGEHNYIFTLFALRKNKKQKRRPTCPVGTT